MPGLHPKSKLEIIENIEKKNVDDIDYIDVMDKIESMMEKYSTVDTGDETLESFDYSVLKGMSPKSITDFVYDNKEALEKEYGITNENIDKFISGINKANIIPYKARKSGGIKDEYGNIINTGQKWGFYKEIDRYEKANDRQNKPIYLRYYKDGTYDVLDEPTFNDEKYFNLLPENMKNKTAIPINEGEMEKSQRELMYDRILSHQSKL